MAELRVRAPAGGDGAQIALAHVRAWQRGYADLLPTDYLDRLDVAERGRAWEDRLAAHQRTPDGPPGSVEFLVVERRESDDEAFRIVGITTIGPERDAPAAEDNPDDATTGEVWMINVDPAAWRLGAGSILLGAASARLACLGYDDQVLWVLEGNDRARRFYEHNGWRPDGATKVDAFGGRAVREVRYRLTGSAGS